MPELPEVETIRRVLYPQILGASIEKIEVLESRLRSPIPANLPSLLRHRRVVELQRHGKYLFFILDQDWVWLQHLGMTGKIFLQAPEDKPEQHLIFSMGLDNGLSLRYHDARRFGYLKIASEKEIHAALHLGPDSLLANPDLSFWKELKQRHVKSIKSVLMDQSLIAGIGNIYANEILACAGIHPQRSLAEIDESSLSRLKRSIRKVLLEAIRFQGSSVSDYYVSAGKKGRFQERFLVYSRDGAPCRTCATKIVAVKEHGRNSFFCPRCQR